MLDVFEFMPDSTTDYRVSCPLISKKLICLHFFSAAIDIILLAHLRQRLIGELIGYSSSGVVVRPSSLTISNIFFSKTACLIKAKFYVEPPWVGGTKVCSRHLGHMTKMATMPIYGKTPPNLLQNGQADFHETYKNSN